MSDFRVQIEHEDGTALRYCTGENLHRTLTQVFWQYPNANVRITSANHDPAPEAV